MKKALAILMILALVGTAAFAEITFGAWGRGIFVPVQNSGASDEDSTATTAVSWGTPNPRVGMTIKGVSDNAGFQIDWNSDGASFGISDQNKIWVKPVSMVTLSVGRVFDDTLRGNACFGAWDWYRAYSLVNTIGMEDFTFHRIDTKNQGFVVAVAPTEAFYINASFNDLGNKQLSENLFGDFQAQAGYTIAGIGTIRAGYMAVQQDEAAATPASFTFDAATGTIKPVAAKAATDKAVDGTVEVAFKYTGTENLYVDIGYSMKTNTDDYADVKKISLYTNYKMDALKIHAIGQYKILEDDDAYTAGAGFDYALAAGITAQADVYYANDIYMSGDDAGVSFFAGLSKGFSNGKVGAGVEINKAADTGYAIPVVLEYWF